MAPVTDMNWWRGSRLSAARRRAALTQVALAGKVGLHPVSLSRLERGARRPSLPMLLKLARALHMEARDFLP